MGHIDEAFKRTGRIGHLIEGPHPSAAADARASAVLERYALEKAPGLDEGKLPPPTPGPWPGGSQPVDVRSSALPASVPAPAEPKGAEPKGIVEKLSKPTAGPQPAGGPQPDDDGASALPASVPMPGEPKGDVEADKIFDFRQIADYVGFVARALVRHKMIAAGTFILALASTAAILRYWPKTYHVQAKLLAQRYDRMAALGNPGRALPPDADVPSRAAGEAVLRRDNLVAIIKQTDLINQWERSRAPILKVKDVLFQRVFGKPPDDEKFDGFVSLLEQRLVVAVSADGMIDISLDFPDARLTYDVVQAAVQNFVETRESSETSAIAESISILGRSADSLQAEIDRSFAELQATQAKRSHELARRAPATPLPILTAPAAAAPVLAPPMLAGASPEMLSELTRQKAALDSAAREIAKLEDLRRQQLSELQTRLAAALTIYTEGHPAISNLRQSIASVSRDSPQLVAMRSEAQRLEAQFQSAAAIVEDEEQKAELARRGVASQLTAQQREKPATTPAEIAAPSTILGLNEAAALAGSPSDASSPSSLRLRLELGQLASIRDRINGAQIELATSQAAFKYRYNVTRPPQVPRRPSKPNGLAILIAGALGALLLAIASSAGADLLGGRIIEPWQMERQVGVPVLIRLGRL